MSDAKVVDWQNGMESGIGAVLAALAGVNLVAGPGMMDFESCQSLEKLVLDDEACGMALRLARGVGHDSAGEAVDLLRQVVELGSFLGHRTHPRPLPRRAVPPGQGDRPRHLRAVGGGRRAGRRSRSPARRCARIVARGNPAPLADDLRAELTALIAAEARRLAIPSLPPV